MIGWYCCARVDDTASREIEIRDSGASTVEGLNGTGSVNDAVLESRGFEGSY